MTGFTLRRLREAAGLSQQELGRLARFPTSEISRVERGLTVSPERLEPLIAALRRGLDERTKAVEEARSILAA